MNNLPERKGCICCRIRSMADTPRSRMRKSSSPQRRRLFLFVSDRSPFSRGVFFSVWNGFRKEPYCIIHFFHRDFRRCKIMDKHLEVRLPPSTFQQKRTAYSTLTMLLENCSFPSDDTVSKSRRDERAVARPKDECQSAALCDLFCRRGGEGQVCLVVAARIE